MKIAIDRFISSLCLAAMVSFIGANAVAGSVDNIKAVQKAWAHANYELKGKEQVQAFEALVSTVEKLTRENPNAAELWVWSGIVKSTYAGVKGGLGALSLAKQSRRDLEQAIEINGNVLDGSAYTSLATLYAQVPAWPIGFGSDKKATKLFEKALDLNPNGIDSNYFYAEFMFEQGRYDDARRYYLKAQEAPARLDRQVADAGRQEEIMAGLEKTNRKLH